MKTINSTWFTGLCGAIGIVVIENEVGERKACMAQITGIDQVQDEERIKTYGAPVLLESLSHIVELLKKSR